MTFIPEGFRSGGSINKLTRKRVRNIRYDNVNRFWNHRINVTIFSKRQKKRFVGVDHVKFYVVI